MKQTLERRARRLVRGDRDDEAALIRAAYLVLLHREPDEDGLATQLAHLDQGWSWLQLLAGLVHSEEFQRTRASGTTEWRQAVIRAAFRSVLWRDPPPEALQWYTRQMEAGLGIDEIVDVLSELGDIPTVAAAIDDHRARRAATEREMRALANRIAALEARDGGGAPASG